MRELRHIYLKGSVFTNLTFAASNKWEVGTVQDAS
jgi:hypothetical protein